MLMNFEYQILYLVYHAVSVQSLLHSLLVDVKQLCLVDHHLDGMQDYWAILKGEISHGFKHWYS